MVQQRRPQPKAGSGRVLRSERPHGATKKARPSVQHARGERILRDGTRVAPRAKARTSTPVRPPRRPGSVRMPLASSPRRLHVLLIVVAIGSVPVRRPAAAAAGLRLLRATARRTP